jgi:hypothetical protein
MNEARKVVVKDSPEIAEEVGADKVTVFTEATEQSETQAIEDDETPLGVDDLPDDELIWPGGPTAGQIKLWKREYGDVYVTSITYDKHIAWRTLNRLEYKNLVKKMEQLVQAGQLTQSEANLWNEEAIAEICVLYPAYDKQSLVAEMAGLPSLISQEVLEASGFLALEVRQL